ncbi:MAG: hypothetical protein ACK401_01180 [Archaeoglobaceae archaeon]
MRIFWEILTSTFGILLGFFIGEKLLKKLGLGNKSKKVFLKFEEIPEYLKNKFLVNSAIFDGERKKLHGIEEVEAMEMRKLLEQTNAEEIVIFRENDCRYALKQGRVFLYVRGRIASVKELSEIWEVVNRSLRGVAK